MASYFGQTSGDATSDLGGIGSKHGCAASRAADHGRSPQAVPDLRHEPYSRPRARAFLLGFPVRTGELMWRT
jgi:hypothetical protein